MNIFALELARIPNVTLKTMLRLAKTMLRDRPKGKDSTPSIEDAIEDLLELIQAIAEAIIIRMIGANPELFASELEFDRVVDALWVLLRRRLVDAQVYAHDGLDLLTDSQAEEAKLEESRALSDRAAELDKRIFGSLSVADIVKASFTDQVESMAAVIGLIEREELRDDLVDVVGTRLVKTIEVCQERYEDMIDDRLGRKRGLSHDLGELRHQLRWQIVAYVNAVQSLVRPKYPETGEAVLGYLQPILTLRESLARNGSEAAAVEDLQDFVELDLPEQAQDVAESIDEDDAAE